MEEPQEASVGNTGTSLTVIAVVVVTVLLTFALIATLMRSSSSTQEPITDAPADLAIPAPAPSGAEAPPTYPLAPTVDPEVEVWYGESLPHLLRVISVLATPPTEDMDILRLRCVQLQGDRDRLVAIGRAPKEDLAAAVDLWVKALDEGVRYCQTASQDVPDDVAVLNTSLAFAASVPTFDSMVEVLASYGIAFGQ